MVVPGSVRTSPWIGVVTVLVTVQLILIGILVGTIVLRAPEQKCIVSVTLATIYVGQDTDPDSEYGNDTTDSWLGNVTLSVGSVTLVVPLDFEGDTGHTESPGATITGEAGMKDEDISYVFRPLFWERDGGPYDGPAPWDVALEMSLGLLPCPGTERLVFVPLVFAINNGEPETTGWLSFVYTVVLDP